MKLDLNSTLEQIDKQIWDEPNPNTYLTKTCHLLRKKPLKDFTIEDLRIMIGQNINLDLLIPLAIKQLQNNILAEGDFYKGDLLKSVLDCESTYWTKNRELWTTVRDLYFERKLTLEANSSFYIIKKSFGHFETI